MISEHWLPANVRAAGIERTLKSRQSLFRMGDAPPGLFEVVKGKVRLVRVDASGRETVLYTAAPGSIVSEASLFAPTYHCNAVASTAAVVRLYPKAVLFAEFERDQRIGQAFMRMLAREIMNLRTRLELFNIHSARARVRHYLALHAGADGRTVLLGGSLKDLAADLGLSHEALYRTLAAMQRGGEVARQKGMITLKSPV